MTFYPMPRHGVLVRLRIKQAPKIDVFDRLLCGGAPALGFPARDPLGDAVFHLAAVGK